MSSPDEMAGHLASCCEAVYQVLGENAPSFTNDKYVVRLHEMSRVFGSLAHGFADYQGYGVAPLAILEEVLTRAADDVTGALVLYVMAGVVGPRFLVTLRDAREEFGDDQEFCNLIDHAAQAIVAEMHTLTARSDEDSIAEDPQWRRSARDLVDLLDLSGNAESFALSR